MEQPVLVNQTHLWPARLPLVSLAFLFLGGCVSLNLAPKGPETSKGVELTAPGAPYQRLRETRADAAWINKRSGASISYFSTCNDPADPGLEQMANELTSELSDIQVIQRIITNFNGREALDVEVVGKAEGIGTRIRSVIFKKNGCSYTLNQIALPSHFESDRAIFADFLKGFRAP